jgi:glycosyltransferase involved in cell wall biosynthesis
VNKTLSILICSLDERSAMLDKLLDSLRFQATPAVEIHVFCDDGTIPSGAKRNKLLEWATGDYVAFVDDDDEVSADYIPQLLKAAESHMDVLTFDVDRIVDGEVVEREIFRLHGNDENGNGSPIVQMQANHLCAWKLDLARMVRFPDWLGYGDDQFWYGPLVASRAAKTEYHINRTLYRYRWSKNGSRNQTEDRRKISFDWCGRGIEAWWLNGRIVIGRHSEQGDPVMVYDSDGAEFAVYRKDLERITTVHVR